MINEKYEGYIEIHVPTRFGHRKLQQPVSDADVEAAMKLADEMHGHHHHPVVNEILAEREIKKIEAEKPVPSPDGRPQDRPWTAGVDPTSGSVPFSAPHSEHPIEIVNEPEPAKRSHKKKEEAED